VDSILFGIHFIDVLIALCLIWQTAFVTVTQSDTIYINVVYRYTLNVINRTGLSNNTRIQMRFDSRVCYHRDHSMIYVWCAIVSLIWILFALTLCVCQNNGRPEMTDWRWHLEMTDWRWGPYMTESPSTSSGGGSLPSFVLIAFLYIERSYVRIIWEYNLHPC